MQSFYELFGDKTLQELISDWQPVPIEVDEADWFHFPPESFVSWVNTVPRYSFDPNPDVAYVAKAPTFLLSQTHRIWLSSKLIVDHCGLTGELVDFGSYPFVVPLTLRDYFGYQGPITATAIQPLEDEARTVLEQHRIQLDLLDLDPYIHDRSRSEQLPDSLAREAESADVVTMFHVVEHLYHPMSALSEAHRILRKGGRLIVTTDNAMMLNTFLNYVSGYGYVFEPVDLTCAMRFHDWRGHVRFFTAQDLQTMAEAAGFSVSLTGFEQVFYDVFHKAYFEEPGPHLSGWQRRILREHRQFANDVFLVATKM